MHLRKSLLYFTIVSVSIFSFLVEADDIATTLYPYIYTNLNNWPCVRLLNATGTIGCHVVKKTSGILYQASTQPELDTFVSTSATGDFALVIPFNLLTRTNLATLSSTGHVSGLIIVLNNSTTLDQLTSPDSSCPNCQFGLYANDTTQYQWNPEAQSLIEENFDFPIFGIRPEDNTSQQVYNFITSSVNYNVNKGYRNYPLKAIDFDLFMWAAVNSETCLRRGWCQVVGGMSVFSSPSLNMDYNDDKPIVVVSSTIDGRSLFHDLTTSSTKDISGMVAVLAIADALSNAPKPLDQLPKHILYTLFTGESWGFAGSQRFVQDIATPFQCTNATRAVKCPFINTPCTFPCVRDLNFKRINLNKIESMFEFQSVSGVNANYSNNFYAHVDQVQQNQPLLTALQSYNNVQSASSDGVERKLPPSSAMSFLQKRRDINAVVITDYQKELGGYYNSDMDFKVDLEKMSNSICGLVNTTANVIYNQASNGNNTSVVSANCTLISSLLDCLVSNFSCPFMQTYFNATGVGSISHYSSVYSFEQPRPQLLQRFAFSFLSGVTGKPRIGSDNQPVACQTIDNCAAGEYCIKQVCVSTITTYHESYGTGLQYDEAKGIVNVVDPIKGTYTESTWDTPTFRIFFVMSKTHQIVELIVGLLWASISFSIVFFLKRYLKKSLKTD